MRFDEARYLSAIGHGASTLVDAAELTPAADGLVAGLPGCDRLELRRKGLVRRDKLDVQTLRQYTHRPGSGLASWADRLEGVREVGFYVFDKDLSERQPPQLTLNLHLSATGKIGGHEVHAGHSGARAGTMLAVALATSVSEDCVAFEDSVRVFFARMNGIRGALWQNAPYRIDGKASVEWAYQNVGAAIPGGDLHSWDPGADRMLDAAGGGGRMTPLAWQEGRVHRGTSEVGAAAEARGREPLLNLRRRSDRGEGRSTTVSSAGDIWVSYLSVQSWLDPGRWSAFLEEAQGLIGAKLTHLDQNDPVRRKVEGESPREWGDYCVRFGPKESTRWIFGRVGSARIRFDARHTRGAEGSPNSFQWYLPEKWASSARAPSKLVELFELGNRHLEPFYSYADALEPMRAKNKASGAVNVQQELVGVIWLTYFDARMPLRELDDAGVSCRWSENGVTLRLADAPWDCGPERRSEVESFLGRHCFADPNSIVRKAPGEYVPTLDELRATGRG